MDNKQFARGKIRVFCDGMAPHRASVMQAAIFYTDSLRATAATAILIGAELNETMNIRPNYFLAVVRYFLERDDAPDMLLLDFFDEIIASISDKFPLDETSTSLEHDEETTRLVSIADTILEKYRVG